MHKASRDIYRGKRDQFWLSSLLYLVDVINRRWIFHQLRKISVQFWWSF